MSWDIFAACIACIPSWIKTVDDVPADFQPEAIGTPSEIITAIQEVVPAADFSDRTWGVIDATEYSIEVSISDKPSVSMVAFHVTGGTEAIRVIGNVLNHLGLRAFDASSETGIFASDDSEKSLRSWQNYRDQIVPDS